LLISGITHLLRLKKEGSARRKSSAAKRSHLDEKLREIVEDVHAFARELQRIVLPHSRWQDPGRPLWSRMSVQELDL
jgi:hypothetical protein